MQGICGVRLPYELLQEIAKTLWCAGSFMLFSDGSSNLAMSQSRGNFVADVQALCVFQQLALPIKDQRVPALENRQRRQRFQSTLQALAAHAMQQENVAHDSDEGGGFAVQLLSHSGEHQAQIVVAHSGRDQLPAA